MAKQHEHMHVQCPRCGNRAFEILVYKHETVIQCSIDGEEVVWNAELEEEFRKGITSVH